jgi:hypothetical protein
MGEHLSAKRVWGTRIINTRTLNDVLILKWVWRIYKQEPEDLCCELLRKKYLNDGPLSRCKWKGSSQFWQGMNNAKHKFKWGGFLQGKQWS